MERLVLVAVGDIELAWLECIYEGLPGILGRRCRVDPHAIDPARAANHPRHQYDAGLLVDMLAERSGDPEERVLELAELLPEHTHIKPGDGDVRPDAVDEEDEDRERELLADLGRSPELTDPVVHSGYACSSSPAPGAGTIASPPAASIFLRALSLKA